MHSIQPVGFLSTASRICLVFLMVSGCEGRVGSKLDPAPTDAGKGDGLDGGPDPVSDAGPDLVSDAGTADGGSTGWEAFPYGVMDHGGYSYGTRLPPTLSELKSRGLRSVFFSGGSAQEVDESLTVSDSLDMRLYVGPWVELYRDWLGLNLTNPTIEQARSLVYPLVDTIKAHSSLVGYTWVDDAGDDVFEKVVLTTQAFKERDPTRHQLPIILFHDLSLYRAAKPDVFFSYAYPVGGLTQACGMDYPGFRTISANSSGQVWRQMVQALLPGGKLYAILQAHGSETATTPGSLRRPSVEEARLQNWLAVAEGAKGIFWFTYSTITNEFWIGIRDNPPLYDEISRLAARMDRLGVLLSGLKRDLDRFKVSGLAKTYGSTLLSEDGKRLYVVAVNHDCGLQDVTVNSRYVSGQLKDVESGRLFPLGSSFSLEGGDGRIFEVMNWAPVPNPPAASPNLLKNGSFEAGAGSGPSEWIVYDPHASRDTAVAHNGSASLKILGPVTSALTQNVNLKPDTLYTLSYWVKHTAMAHGLVLSYQQDHPVIEGMGATPDWVSGPASDWTRVFSTFYPGLSYVDGEQVINFDLAVGETAWIDDVVLCEGKECQVP